MVVVRNRYSIYWSLLFLLFVSNSCETYSKKTLTISGQGIANINFQDFTPSGILMDTVLFADGNEHIVLTGVISSASKSHTYTLHFDKAPWVQGAKLLFCHSTMDEVAKASIQYKLKGSVMELVWNLEDKRVFLRDKLSKNIHMPSN